MNEKQGTSGEQRAKVQPLIPKHVIADFRKWKQELIGIIKKGAHVQANPNGTYTYVLPPKLVKLVWGATIKERVAYASSMGEENPTQAALTKLRDEIGEAAEKLSTLTPKEIKNEVQSD